MALHLTFSNRFESLLEALLVGLAEPRASAFVPDHLIVPSVGMQRRIELATADAFGICANVEFSFLAQWLWREIAAVVPVGETSPFAPSRLAWRIFRILGERGFVQPHAALAAYLGGADAPMRHDLAQRVAKLFDHYITYRPDWLAAWSDGRSIPATRQDDPSFVHQSWQASLWRRVAAELGTARQHPSVAFFDALAAGGAGASADAADDPVHVFCLPSIPPLYLRMLDALGNRRSLHLYVLNPSHAYWFDIVDPRRLAYLQVTGQADHHEVANTLLAQWGKQTQAHIDLLLTTCADTATEAAAFVPAEGDHLLARVQRSILELDPIVPGAFATLADGDRSIEVHVGHSLARQLEVLHDQLLAMLVADPSLRPANVLVVVPQLEEAAPLIDAVFGNAPPRRHLPYAITGRARSKVNPAARALLDLLGFATSRFEASTFFEVLQQPLVARRFGLDTAGLDVVRRWMGDAGIRWGLDADHRIALALPGMARYSFEDGMHRLFLGYALPSAGSRNEWITPVDARLPAGAAEGREALALGALWRVLQALAALRRELAEPRSGGAWFDTLKRAVDTFLEPDDDALEAMRELEGDLRDLRDAISAGADAAPITVDVIRVALAEVLDDPARGGVPGGGVTFAAMTSLRNLPYRVICAIGLDDGAFPAIDRPLEFDLIAAVPRRGDRQRRTEDRTVFLDLLLAARERFYLAYTGRDIRDHAVLPPSVLIADLLDVLIPAIARDPESPDALNAARGRLVIEHPLQAFSSAGFRRDGDPRLRSFNEEYCDALLARVTTPVEIETHEVAPADEAAEATIESRALAFFAMPLDPPEDAWRNLTLPRLLRFYRNPSRYLLGERLGLQLAEAEDELEDSEPFLADLEARSELAKRLLPAMLAGEDPTTIRAMARAGVEYPPGLYGHHLLDGELAALHLFAQGLRTELAPAVLPARSAEVEFEIDGKAWRLEGAFGDIRPTGRVRHRYDDVRPFDYLQGWIEHLFLNVMQAEGATAATRWHSRNGCYTLQPVVEARAHLQGLVELYARGLRAPLHFFPKSAWKYVSDSMAAARKAWTRTYGRWPGEDHHPAYRLCLRGVDDPLNDAFVDNARRIFEPLLECIDDPRLP
ncbi:MAG: exodeoxyribonuclease V subunit gamma [Casimicrobiaceae bacterium]